MKYTSRFPYKFHFPGQKFCMKGAFEDICLACVGISEYFCGWNAHAGSVSLLGSLMDGAQWVWYVQGVTDLWYTHQSSEHSVCSRSQNIGKTREHPLTSCCLWNSGNKYGSPINTGKLRCGEDACKTVRNGETSYGSCFLPVQQVVHFNTFFVHQEVSISLISLASDPVRLMHQSHWISC